MGGIAGSQSWGPTSFALSFGTLVIMTPTMCTGSAIFPSGNSIYILHVFCFRIRIYILHKRHLFNGPETNDSVRIDGKVLFTHSDHKSDMF